MYSGTCHCFRLSVIGTQAGKLLVLHHREPFGGLEEVLVGAMGLCLSWDPLSLPDDWVLEARLSQSPSDPDLASLF